MKKALAVFIATAMAFGLIACGRAEDNGRIEKAEVRVFVAASLRGIMQEFKEAFEAEHENAEILINADSSGTLMMQIREGAACDVFFSAASKQMDMLEEEGFLIEGTRKNVVNNRLVLIAQSDAVTSVTGLENIGRASSIALADGSVPAGSYTRKALMNLGILGTVEDPSLYSTREVSDALGGVEISEQSNVSKVLTAVEEGSCEVGTVYLSDTYGHEEKVRIIEAVPNDITGSIIYPAALLVNPNASSDEALMAAAFLEFITNYSAQARYEEHLFDPCDL